MPLAKHSILVRRKFIGCSEVDHGGAHIKQIGQKGQVDRVKMLIWRDDCVDSGCDGFESLVPFQIGHRSQRKNYHGCDHADGDGKSNEYSENGKLKPLESNAPLKRVVGACNADNPA